jgi:streptogramin lyase
MTGDGTTGRHPHAIRTDQHANAWFTVTMSNRLLKFDTRAERFTGISPLDGSIWRGKRVRVDPRTTLFETIDLPVRAVTG